MGAKEMARMKRQVRLDADEWEKLKMMLQSWQDTRRRLDVFRPLSSGDGNSASPLAFVDVIAGPRAFVDVIWARVGAR